VPAVVGVRWGKTDVIGLSHKYDAPDVISSQINSGRICTRRRVIAQTWKPKYISPRPGVALHARDDAGNEPALLAELKDSDMMLGITRRPSTTASIP